LHVEPSITFEQYRAALEAMRKPSDKRFGRSQWLRVAVIIILSFSIFIAVKTPDTQHSSLVFLISLIPLYIALSLWGRFRTKSCLKQAYTAQEKQLQGQRMDVDESGIIGQWADGNASYHTSGLLSSDSSTCLMLFYFFQTPSLSCGFQKFLSVLRSNKI
jgi:hypothetical protein